MNFRKGFGFHLAAMAVVFTASLLAGFSAMADELIMKDGSRLLGKVVTEDGGVVSF